MDWGALDADGGAGGGVGMINDDADVQFVGMDNSGEAERPRDPRDLPDPAEDPEFRRVSPGQYVKYANEVNMPRQPEQHNGRPMYRVSPGKYVVTDRPMQPQRGRPAKQQSMGDWDWGEFASGMTQAATTAVQTGLQYVSAEAEREARAAEAAGQRELERERMVGEREQAEREFSARLEREEAAATAAAERRAVEHEQRMAELRAEAEGVSLAPGLPGWAIALIAVGGLGAVGVIAMLMLKKD